MALFIYGRREANIGAKTRTKFDEKKCEDGKTNWPSCEFSVFERERKRAKKSDREGDRVRSPTKRTTRPKSRNCNGRIELTKFQFIVGNNSKQTRFVPFAYRAVCRLTQAYCASTYIE